MSKIMEKLWQRHKNPLSWILRPIFSVTLIYGIWFHDSLVIWVSVIGLATSWFWFPKPKAIPEWAERFIDKEGEWLRGLRSGGVKEIAWTAFAVIVVTIWIYVIWLNNLVLTAALTGLIIGAKLIWSAMLERSVAKPLTILALGSYAVGGIILVLIIWFAR